MIICKILVVPTNHKLQCDTFAEELFINESGVRRTPTLEELRAMANGYKLNVGRIRFK